MKTSTTRILTTHVGSLPRPPELIQRLLESQARPGADRAALDASVDRAVADVVKRQARSGLDVINDGEQGRVDYTVYLKDRLTGFDGQSAPPLGTGDEEFPELAAILRQFASPFQHRRKAKRSMSMRRLFAPAALAAAIAISILPAMAWAEDDLDTVETTDVGVGQPLDIDTIFDLGIDVTGVPKTPAAAKAFLLGLAPGSQSIIRTTCAHYVQNPEGVASRDTLEFCENVRG